MEASKALVVIVIFLCKLLKNYAIYNLCYKMFEPGAPTQIKNANRYKLK